MASGEQHNIQSVGVAFVKKFFETLNKTPDVLYKYFLAQGLFSYTDPSQALTASGQEQIKDAFDSLDLANCRIGKIDLPRVVAQPLDDFVLVFTNGLWVANRSFRRFFASFCLQKRRSAAGGSYDVRNASFILLQEDDAHISLPAAAGSPAAETASIPSSPATTPASPSPAPAPTPAPAPAPAPVPAPVAAAAPDAAAAPAPPAEASAVPSEAVPAPAPEPAAAAPRKTYAEASSNPAAAPSTSSRSKAPSKRPAGRARPAPAATAAATTSTPAASTAPEAATAAASHGHSRSSPKQKSADQLWLVLRGVPVDCPQAEVLEPFKNVGVLKSYSHDTSKTRLVFVRFAGVSDPNAVAAQLTASPVLIRGARVVVELNRGPKTRAASSSSARTSDQPDKQRR